MKQFYRITRNTESKPSRLIASVVLAFIVMLFVNGFIGGMGGFSSFIAFAGLCCFFGFAHGSESEIRLRIS